jgi:shikimate kinase
MANLVLIGFMGVGKGRAARELARQSGRFALDTDDLIESYYKKKIRKIFAEEGEAVFRELEGRVAKWLAESVVDTVVSTGGGFFQVEGLKRIGRVVYLHASLDHIIARIKVHPQAEKKIKKRPLLSDMDQARELYRQRLPRYRQVADLEINVEELTVGEVAKQLMQEFGD